MNETRLATAQEYGIPPIAPSRGSYPGKALAWIRGVKVDSADWFLLKCDTTIRYYLEAGGDPNKGIISHLHSDEVLTGYWWKKTFFRRIERYRDFGIKHITATTISSYAIEARIEQAYGIYRNVIITNDFVKAGFNIVPVLSPHWPFINNLYCQVYGQRDFLIIDLCHKLDKQTITIIRPQTDLILGVMKPKHIWLYCNSKRSLAQWRARYGEVGIVVPAMTMMMSEMGKQIKKYRKTLVSADRETVLSGGGVEEMPAEKD